MPANPATNRAPLKRLSDPAAASRAAPSENGTGQRSGDDVRNVAVADHLDLILEPELALLEASDFELVGVAAGLELGNFLIKAAMLGLEHVELGPRRLVVIHQPTPLAESRMAVEPAARLRQAAHGQGQAEKRMET